MFENYRFLKIMQSGINKKYFITYYKDNVITCPEEPLKRYHENLGFGEIQIVYMNYWKVVLVAFGILVIEKIVSICFKSNEQKCETL
jgi:hypothetical protein